MLIEQMNEMIEFKFRGPWSYLYFYNWLFYDKPKTSKKNFRLDFYLLIKFCSRAMYLAFPYLGQITYKI